MIEEKKPLLDLWGNAPVEEKRTMSDFFGVPPFSVLNTMDAKWQERKKRWSKLINDTGQARKNVLAPVGSLLNKINGTSILDSVLSELMIKWFTEPGWDTFDPFAGDTVFGFVSSWLERPFVGIELRQEQVDFNQMQCDAENLPAKYICDTAENIDNHIKDNSKDFIFSCPPYADLEKYSNLPDDLSNMSHEDFFSIYEKVLQKTFKKLKDNRFAVVVTSEVRGKDGGYIRLMPNTIDIMVGAGYIYYNDIILVNSVGTLPLRVGKQMNVGRKVGRRHQNILVFYKGDPKQIRNNFTEIIPKNQYYGG